MTSELELRVRTLEQRIATIEEHVGLRQIARPVLPLDMPAPPPASPPAPDELLLEEASIADARETAPPIPAIATAEAVAPVNVSPPAPAQYHEWAQRLHRAPEIESLPYAAQRPLPQTSPARHSTLETAIGLKWAGWIGAVVLAIGVIFGVKYAYDQGWLPSVSIAMRFLMMAAGGLALIAAGEWVYRKVNRFSSVGLFGAGVGVLFIVSYAGQAYSVYGRDAAFVLMGLCTLAGAVVAMRGKFVSIAVLSLIGGNLAPLLLHSDSPHIPVFLGYLFMLQAAALFLAAWGNSKQWWALRLFSLITTALWIAMVLTGWHASRWYGATQIFILISAAAFQAELILGYLRVPADSTAKRWSAGGAVVYSVVVTALLALAVREIHLQDGPAVQGAWMLALAAACSLTGLTLYFRRSPRTTELAIGYRFQGVALLLASVPVFFHGEGVLIGWGILALAFAAIGTLRDLRVARVAASATWMLAVAYLYLWAVQIVGDARANSPVFSIAQRGIPLWGLYAGILAIGAQAIAWLQQRAEKDSARAEPLSNTTAILGSALWVVASIIALPSLPATVSLVLYAWFLIAADLVPSRVPLATHAIAVLLVSMVKWAVVDQVAARFSPTASAASHLPVLNPIMAVGVLVTGTTCAVALIRREKILAALERWSGKAADQREAGLVFAGAITLVLTIGLSFDIDRTVTGLGSANPWPVYQLQMVLWTALWTVAAVGMLALAKKVETSPLGWAVWLARLGWIPTALAAKFIFADTLAFVLWNTAGVMVLASAQALAGLCVLGGLILVRYFRQSLLLPEGAARPRHPISGAMMVALPFCIGLLEIDRAFDHLVMPNRELAKNVAFSIYGSLFAIGSVVTGFRIRSAPLRYFGLGLFGVTLLKVVVIDMSQAGTGWRILSFIGLGMLLLGTSVVYGKLSPKLLGEQQPA